MRQQLSGYLMQQRLKMRLLVLMMHYWSPTFPPQSCGCLLYPLRFHSQLVRPDLLTPKSHYCLPSSRLRWHWLPLRTAKTRLLLERLLLLLEQSVQRFSQSRH